MKLYLGYFGSVIGTTFVSGVYGGYKHKDKHEAIGYMFNGFFTSLAFPLIFPVYIGKGIRYLENKDEKK